MPERSPNRPNTPETKLDLYKKIIYKDRNGQEVILQNATVFEPVVTAEYRRTNPHQHEALVNLLGEDYDQKLADKTIVVPYVFAGWGHMFQAFAAAAELSRLGVKTIVVDIEELASTREKEPLALKQLWLKALHARGRVRERMEDVFKKIDHSLHLNKLQKLIMGSIFQIANSYMEQFEPSFKPSLMHRFQSFLTRNTLLFSQMLQTGVWVDAELNDKPLQAGFVNFLEQFRADYVVATHGTPVRALKSTAWEEKAIVAVPDPGYGFNGPEQLQPMATGSDKTIYAIPQVETVAQNLLPYGIKPEQIIQTGTIGFTPELTTLSEKWQFPLRQILMSTSGNASNMDYLAQAVRDGETEFYKEGSPYRVFILLGEHRDALVAPVLNAVKEIEVRHASQPIPGLTIVRTNNLAETAFWKWFLKWNCQVEIGKPGENPLDAPISGTVFIGLPAAALNEEGNMWHAVDRKTAIPSAWPPDVYEYWHKTKLTETEGLLPPQDNLFTYLDALYVGPIKNYAERCLATVKNGFTPQFFVGATALYQMLASPQNSLLGPNSASAKNRLQQFIFQRTPKV